MIIEQKSIRVFLGESLLDIMKKNEKIVHLSPDGSILGDLADQVADRHFDVGIAEQNLIGIASGLALKGKFPVVNSIAGFVVTNAYMQIRDLICYHNLDLVIIGVGAGLTYSSLGYTHHAHEDISLMKTLPNMKIYMPADGRDAVEALKDAIYRGGPSYIRLDITKTDVGLKGDRNISFSLPQVIHAGSRILLLCNGYFVGRVFQMIGSFENLGFSPTIVNLNSTDFSNRDKWKELIKDYEIVFTIEDHYANSGVGSSIRDLFPEFSIVNLGMPNEFCNFAGSREELNEYYGLGDKDLFNQICYYAKK